MKLTRKKFLKFLSAIVTIPNFFKNLFDIKNSTSEEELADIKNKQLLIPIRKSSSENYGSDEFDINYKKILIDVSKCNGCKECEKACSQWNQLEENKQEVLSGNKWTVVETIKISKYKSFRKRQCMHCNNATCIDVCPTGAAKEHITGIVYIDQNICTGCKYCVMSCPFGSIHFNHKTGTAQKCRMCIDRVLNNLSPACASVCPTGAILFDYKENLLEIAYKRKKELEKQNFKVRIYGEKELDGLGVMYILPFPASIYHLPENPKMPNEKHLFWWLQGSIQGIIISLAVLFGFLKKKEKDGN